MAASLVRKADLVLYESKNTGRSQVNSYGELGLADDIVMMLG